MNPTHEALLVDKTLSIRLGRRELEPPRAGEALLAMEWAGVCGSDLHVLRTGAWVTQWPATLGHEAVGRVVACPGQEFDEGALVVLDSRVPCGSCPGCRRAANQCESLRWVGEAFPGGFQRHAVLPVSQLVPCPEGMESAIAVLAEPLAVAIHAVNRAGDLSQRILILGYGPVGALVHTEISLRRPDAHVFVIEPLIERAQLASAAGAHVLGEAPVTPSSWPLVFDAAGYAGALADAIGFSANGGTVVLVAVGHSDVVVTPQEITERALTISGSNGFDDELPLAIDRLHANPDRYRWLITESILLEEAPARLGTLSSSPSVGKVVIRL